MEFKSEDYHISYDAENSIVVCKGALMLNGAEEYAPMLDLMKNAATKAQQSITLDLRGLEFTNSSGINTFIKFIIAMREQNRLHVVGLGLEAVPWQAKLLKNLQRLLSSLELKLE